MNLNKIYKTRASILLILLIPIFIFISCGENKELIRQNQIAYDKAVKQQQLEEKIKMEKILKAKAFLDEMYLKYPGLTDYNKVDNYIRLKDAYNNPEENPKISNPSKRSKNEFEYQRMKESYKQTRSIKYLLLGFHIDSEEMLKEFNFKNESYTISYDHYARVLNLYTRLLPQEGREKTLNLHIYDGNYGIDLTVKKNKNIIISMPPEQAERFKENLKCKEAGGLSPPPCKPKDFAKMYVVFKVKGKTIEDDNQSIEAEIVDYIGFWFIDAGMTFEGRINSWDNTFEHLARNATDIIVIKKP